MKKKILAMLLAVALIFGLLTSFTAFAAEGDPGENVNLIAHYPLAGDTDDVTRYSNNAVKHGADVTFVEDSRFGTVLDMYQSGTSSERTTGVNYLSLPQDLLESANSLTVTTWIYNRTTYNNAKIFDFGTGSSAYINQTPRVSGSSGHSAGISKGTEQSIVDPNGQLTANTWIHVAVTLDADTDTLKLYRDGVLVGERAVTVSLSEIINQADTSVNNMFIGRSQSSNNDLNARLSDFRVYDVALTAAQVNEVRNEKFTDAEIAAADLSYVMGTLGTLTNRTDDFTLPTTTLSGSTVAWTSSNNTYLNATTGVVTRPAYTYGSAYATITLTATVTKGTASVNQAVTVTIPRLPTPTEIVASDSADLSIDTVLKENIDLPLTGTLGSTISWASSNPNVVTATGVVTRPAIGAADAIATLTATFTYGSASIKRAFTVVVRAMTSKPVLIDVPRVAVTTTQGDLPRIPFYVPGTYANGVEGDMIRVNWDCPAGGTSAKTTIYDTPGIVSQTKRAVRANYDVTANIFVVSKDSYASSLNSNGSYDVLTDVVKNTDNTMSGTVRIVNAGDTAVNAKAIVSIYDQNGAFAGTQYTNVTVDAAGNASTTVPFTLPEGYTAKVFTWDGATFVPLVSQSLVGSEASKPAEKDIVAKKFDLADIRLTNAEDGSTTVFQQNTSNMADQLLNINPDTYLYTFRYTYGLLDEHPAGTPSPTSWDSYDGKLKGHGTGHYLSGLAQVYESLDDSDPRKAQVFANMNYVVDELYKISLLAQGDPTYVPAAYDTGSASYLDSVNGKYYAYYYTDATIRKDVENWGKGYISAYAPDQFIMLEKGAGYSATVTSTTTIWAPYYTLHKLMNGFINIYTVAGNEKGLEMAKNMGLWVYERLRQLPQATLNSMWSRYIAGEYGGMNEVMATLYDLTKDERMLECAQLFDNVPYFFGNNGVSGLANNVDTIRSRHANQHIPQITGALKIYDGSKDSRYYNIADNFWYMVKECYAYSIGGVGGKSSNYEAFPNQPNVLLNGTDSSNRGCLLTTSVNSCESCGMYNLLKLSTQLFLHDNEAKYMDYYEQTLYNGIAGGIAKTGGGNTYGNPIYRGATRSFSAATTGSSCCGGTARESHTKYGDSIYFRAADDSALYVNLFIPSTLNWEREGASDVKVTQITNYPYSDTVKLVIDGSGEFTVKARVPHWAKSYTVKVNGVLQNIKAEPGSYIDIDKVWTAGDVIELIVPCDFWLDRLNEDTNVASLMYGPFVMCAEETAASATLRTVELDGADINNSVSNFNRSALTATIDGVSYKPFIDYRAEVSGSSSRCSVYLDVTRTE